jgi:hypothetical protein
LLIEGLKIVPAWIWSATAWYLFTKLVLDRLSPSKPGTEINLAIIGGDLLPNWAGGELIDIPPGVKVGALIDVILAGADVLPEIFQIPPGTNLIEQVWKEVFLPFWIITTGGGQVPGSG